MHKLLTALLALATPALAQERPAEADLFGSAADAPTATPADAGTGTVDLTPAARDSAELGGPAIVSRFDTDAEKADPLKLGGTLMLNGQGYWQEGRDFAKGSFTAPSILDLFLDARPNDRVRAYAQGRLQWDATKPIAQATTASTTSVSTGSSVGLTTGSAANPSVALDQLWLRFDVARTLYLTVGRQKVRWGVSRIWYPTDFLNSQPRDALNPFDQRLGVNLVKVHLPIESLGWNFYAYGLMDSPNTTTTGLSLDSLGGAARAEFLLGPAEIGLGGAWQKGRRPRYGVDVSAPLGPVDLYAEVAFRSAKDFVLFNTPDGTTPDNLISRLGDVTTYRPDGLMVQASGGASWQFNYTDKNTGILGVEYFYNPAGYENVTGYQVSALASNLGVKLDPIQQAPLYGGRHNLALTLSAPGLPNLTWVTVSLSNIVVLNDPSALTRLDVSLRVLTYLNIQLFAAAFYGQTGGQLRFQLTPQEINELANLSEATTPGSGAALRSSLSNLRYPPVVQAGIILRVSI
jgi:hypothetical protein